VSERILVVDDEELLRASIAEFLGDAGYEVQTAADGSAAIEAILEQSFGVVISDIRMPGLDGISLLRRVVAERPETFVILMTAYGTTQSAVDALRAGAFDYVLKPLDLDDLLARVQQLFEHRAMKQELGRLRRAVQERLGFEGIVGGSAAMERVAGMIDKVAPTPSTVLITGESGTGKELVARALHAGSEQASREFLAVNVAALPENLLEAQLFGHEKGAFTGAVRKRDGIFRSARGSTVFLDEIGEMPMSAQSRLLRALEAREVLPVGADRPVAVDFRLLAATNRDLEERVKEGRFREDLFFRLDVFRVQIPPLRQRKEDLPALVQHFGVLHSRAMGRTWLGTTNDAMRALTGYDWPGNVRELSNLLERAVILAGGQPVSTLHLPDQLANVGPSGSLSLREAVTEFERGHVRRALELSGGNREEAARLLDVDRATLYRRLDKLGLK